MYMPLSNADIGRKQVYPFAMGSYSETRGEVKSVILCDEGPEKVVQVGMG